MLAELAGAVLVLDAGLKIVASTRRAAALLGFEVPLGQSALRMLYEGATERLVAERSARSFQSGALRTWTISGDWRT